MTDPILSVTGVHVTLSGRHVLQGVNLFLRPGEFVGLIGPNGAGKTTLLRSVLGLIPVRAGTISVAGATTASKRRKAGVVGYVPQKHQFAWDFPISVRDAVLNGRAATQGWLRRKKVSDYEAAARAIERVRLTDLADRPIGELSGGQRQRVLVARALAIDPRILLLDEPFTGMDVPSSEQLLELFGDLAADGLCVLMSTHDLPQARYSCQRLILLNRTVIAEGRPGDLATPEPWMETFGVREGSPLLASVGVN